MCIALLYNKNNLVARQVSTLWLVNKDSRQQKKLGKHVKWGKDHCRVRMNESIYQIRHNENHFSYSPYNMYG